MDDKTKPKVVIAGGLGNLSRAALLASVGSQVVVTVPITKWEQLKDYEYPRSCIVPNKKSSKKSSQKKRSNRRKAKKRK